jgi:3'-5' exoribonuclease
MTIGQEADLFALLSAREELTTRDGKPYFKVSFRDDRREVSFPVWNDSPWAADCKQNWQAGDFYKLRAVYRETNYGPQLDLKRIRPILDTDAADGFDPLMFQPRSRYEPARMFEQLIETATAKIGDAALRNVVLELLAAYRETLLTLPAATRNHHAFVGGWLEHVRSVAQNASYFAEKYAEYYPDLNPPLNKDLVVAGAILHDIGKVRELEQSSQGTEYTEAGNLIGHIVQGRDLVRETPAAKQLDPETLLRLEHIILSHQRLPEWGSPKPPMTPEALLVHYADDLDAKFNMVFSILRDHTGEAFMTTKKNILMQPLYRGKA